MRNLLLIFCVSFSLNAHADFFQKKDFKLSLGIQGRSLLYKRGMLLYSGVQPIPILAVDVFNPNLIFTLGKIYFKQPLIKDRLNLRLNLAMNAIGDKPLIKSAAEENSYPEREKSTELECYIEYIFEGGSFSRLSIHRDFTTHKSNYYEAGFNINLSSLIGPSEKKGMWQPGAFINLGHGDGKHNEFLYGEGANVASLNNLEYGLIIHSPKVIDIFWPTVKLTSFQILGDENKSGSLVQKTRQFSFEFLIAKQIL